MKLVTPAIVLAIAITLPCLCHAQGEDLMNRMIPKPVPASPNAAGLGKYGDYQVSHFTGIPEISIPIFEAKSGALSVPVTLNYHASGVKPTDVASWVGIGWSLSAGGQISRTVHGKPDEEYYFTHPLNTEPTNCFNYTYLERASRFNDTEGDIFSYSYPGRTGKFAIPNNGTYVNELSTAPIGTPFLFPYAPIIINRIHANKYEITDEAGVLYRFGTNSQGLTSTEATNSYNSGIPSINATTTCNLMDIEAPNSDDKILFTYQNVGTAISEDVTHSYMVKDECFVDQGGTCPQATHLVAQKIQHYNHVNQEGLQTITFENGQLQFILGSEPRADASQLQFLDRIVIKGLVNGSYETVKTVQFLYSYFTDANGNKIFLKLDGVNVLDNAGVAIQKYKFSYFTNLFSWNKTHVNFWNARDLWGFYNGATSNEDLVLPTTIAYQQSLGGSQSNIMIGKAYNRSVNTNYIKEGVLSRIDFPTGGYTEFDYESNRYLNNQSVATDGGGLRIKKITTKESVSALPIVKVYKYGASESGVGRALFTQNQFQYSATQLYASECPANVNFPVVSFRIRTYHSNTALVGDSPSPVVYTYVTEYVGDPAGVINGKTVYEYDGGVTYADQDHLVYPSSKYYKNNLSWKRGKLTKKTIYDGVGNKIKETAIQYSTLQEGSRIVGQGVYAFKTGSPMCTYGVDCVNEYGDWVDSETHKYANFTQNTGVLLETSITETTYERGSLTKYLSVATYRAYDTTKLQVLYSLETSSNSSEQTVTVNTYPFQLPVNSSSTGNALGVYMLNNKNILTTPIETYSFVQKPDSTNRRVFAAQVSTYKQSDSNANHVVPDQIFIYENANKLSTYAPVIIKPANDGLTFNASLKPRINFISYDEYGNIQNVSKTNDVTVSYKWGYNNSLPVAEITNTLAKNVFYDSFEDESVNFWIGGKTGTKSSNNTPYSKALTLLDPGSYILSYYKMGTKWDYYESAVTVPANGTYTISLPAGRYDEIRFYPKTAQLKTYTYNPLVGITSMTDPNGITMYYEYDTFSRLKLIRDNNSDILKTYEYQYKIMN